MAGSRYRLVQALLVFAGWMLITGLFGRLWERVAIPPILKPSGSGLAPPNYLAAIVFLGVAIAVFRWWDVGLSAPRSLRSLLLLWFPGLYVVVFLGLVVFIGLPPVGTMIPILVATALAGISEELACRGVLYQGLRSRLSVWPAILLSTALFGAGHLANGFVLGNFAIAGVQSIAAFMTGISFMAIRVRTGSLYPGMVLHALWDFSLLMVASALVEHADLSEASGGAVPAAALLLPVLGVLPNFLYGLFLLRHVARDQRAARAMSGKVDSTFPSGIAEN
jgi:membrane protease YdiL (CAAX protease family)